jgi:hypothetical protein
VLRKKLENQNTRHSTLTHALQIKTPACMRRCPAILLRLPCCVCVCCPAAVPCHPCCCCLALCCYCHRRRICAPMALHPLLAPARHHSRCSSPRLLNTASGHGGQALLSPHRLPCYREQSMPARASRSASQIHLARGFSVRFLPRAGSLEI